MTQGRFGTPDASMVSELQYDHAFDIRINFDRRWDFGPVSGGARHGYTSVGKGGTVSGPLLNGEVVDYSGADWPVVRTDGVVELNAHYMLLADDGTRIYLHNRGYVHGAIRASAAAGGGELAPYFGCTPYFRAPEGAHEWLNRTVVVGRGYRHPRRDGQEEQDYTLFRYFIIR
jgi:hypothetical protein